MIVPTLLALVICGQFFEVASVKLHPWEPQNINITTSGPRFRAEAEMARGLILYAYNLKRYQLAYASPSLADDDDYFDIEAKAEGDAAPSKEQFRLMLQSLLADRFKLRVHHEQRETPVYVLSVGKGGPKFKESAPDAQASGRHGVNGRNQTMTLTKAAMDDVAQNLWIYAGLPVLDKTGLTGAYEIKFEATPYYRLNRDPDHSDISVFAAVQQQLGLKLDAQKAMIDVLVVDHVEKPSGN